MNSPLSLGLLNKLLPIIHDGCKNIPSPVWIHTFTVFYSENVTVHGFSLSFKMDLIAKWNTTELRYHRAKKVRSRWMSWTETWYLWSCFCSSIPLTSPSTASARQWNGFLLVLRITECCMLVQDLLHRLLLLLFIVMFGDSLEMKTKIIFKNLFPSSCLKIK